MKLSVIVPNFNNADYLEDCLESIINQTYKPYEVIVSDDASTDNSIDIIKKYEKKYDFIRRIFHKKNKGVAFNRHDAILHAKGDYITTIDSDDFFYDKKKIEEEIKLIKKFKDKYNKDIISYSNTVLVDEMGDKIKDVFDKDNIIEGNIFFNVITRSAPIPRDFIFKKTQYLQVGGYDFKISLYEDWDLNIRLAYRYEFYFTGTYGTAYRQHYRGLSSSNYKEHVKWLKKVFFKNFELIDDVNKQKILREFNLYLLDIFIKNVKLNIEDKNILLNILSSFNLVDLSKINNIKDLISKKLKTGEKIVIYGAGKHTETLLTTFRFDKYNIISIVDKNEKLWGKKINGITINSPHYIKQVNPNKVIISSFDYQEKIKNYLKKDLNYQGEIITFYGKKDKCPFYQLKNN